RATAVDDVLDHGEPRDRERQPPTLGHRPGAEPRQLTGGRARQGQHDGGGQHDGRPDDNAAPHCPTGFQPGAQTHWSLLAGRNFPPWIFTGITHWLVPPWPASRAKVSGGNSPPTVSLRRP